MIVKIYRSSINSNRHGMVEHPNGVEKLPVEENNSWDFFKEIDINPKSTLIGADPVEIINSINRDGYYINEVEIVFTEQ